MLNNYCTDYALAGTLYVIQRLVTIIQIVVPIILLISVSVMLTQMIINPEEKKNKNRIKNSFIAAIVVFFIPMLINLVIGMVDSNNNFLKCWRDAKNININIGNSHYIKIDDGRDIKKIINDYEYESGDAKENNDVNYRKDVDGFMNAVKATVDHARANNYHYGDSHGTPPTSDGIISCDRLASKALWDIGYTDQRPGGEVVSTLDKYLTSHGWTKSTNINDCKYGSIVLVSHSGTSGSPYHAFVVNSYKNGVMTTYDEGAEWRIHSNQPFNSSWNQSSIYGVYNME